MKTDYLIFRKIENISPGTNKTRNKTGSGIILCPLDS